MKRCLLALFILLFAAFAALAQTDDEGNSNDPSFNENANACFDGGSMEGKCNIDFDGNGTVDDYEVDWAWECGWYLIRYDYGLITNGQVPTRCHSLFSAGLLCFNFSVGGISLRYNGNPNEAGNLTMHIGLGCTGSAFATLSKSSIIFAGSYDEAFAICSELGTPYSLALMTDLGYESAAEVYGCDFF